MGSQDPPKLPVVDFTKEALKPGTSSWTLACENVRNALEEYGCFVAVYDKVSLDLDKAFFSSLVELFDLPTETKAQNIAPEDKPYFGYFGQVPLLPLYESMGIDEAPTLQGTQAFTNLMWPKGNAHFCETVQSYAKLVSELEQTVMRMVFESYGVEKNRCESHIQSTTYLLRVMKYRSPQMGEPSVGVNPHTDKSFITILHQNQVNGLEVETKDGEWIGFEPLPSHFVVMAADAFVAWSNNRVHSVSHRVIMNGNGVRYSSGLFSFQKEIIQVPEELVDDEHPLQFKPFDHMSMFRFYFTNMQGQDGCCAKAYCGV
ncbi:2-oxoglutarate (2OG) and Fe(II)-dependent oxygenase superfamily protein [Actinidia rufa]|uniref:2-oxoglutarate (2OG) and Fe(II)-dependent oxygenase superfamily protein n=1 Tax=Actinidia rufa TaxID=165716 RepID=A0A7J0F203_9ERIC|nr:2-oxoglutarate (2OG) and Fe(II)-dependent oxygenase superfamily protein [Actinidia rufa]